MIRWMYYWSVHRFNYSEYWKRTSRNTASLTNPALRHGWTTRRRAEGAGTSRHTRATTVAGHDTTGSSCRRCSRRWGTCRYLLVFPVCGSRTTTARKEVVVVVVVGKVLEKKIVCRKRNVLLATAWWEEKILWLTILWAEWMFSLFLDDCSNLSVLPTRLYS